MNGLPFDVGKLIEFCRQHGIVRVGLFGSVARGEATDESDLDLLVEFSRRISLLNMVALERELSAAVGRKVDLLTEEAISPYLRDRIRQDLRVIYEEG